MPEVNQLQTITNENTVRAVDDYAKSYVNFTSNLITNTFDALVDANLQQMEDYVNYVKVLSKDLTTYINDTKDDVGTDEILNFIENLDLEKFELLGEDFNGNPTFIEQGENGELYEVNTDNKIVLRDNEGKLVSVGGKDKDEKTKTGGVSFSERLFGGIFGTVGSEAAKTVGTVIKNIDIPEDTGFGKAFGTIQDILFPGTNPGDELDTSKYKYPKTNTTKINTITNSFMQAMAVRVQQSKYTLLKEMVELGLLRNVIDSGFIETGFMLSFKEKDVYKEKKKDVVRDRSKEKTKERSKDKLGFLPFFKRKQKRKYKQKSTHFEVHKTKTNKKDSASAEVNYDARVRINFHTDYKPIAS